MNKLNLLAFDLGASSGRGVLGKFDGEKLSIEEIHRFSNDPVDASGHLYWDVLRMLWEVKQGLLKYSINNSEKLMSIGIDTWGSDFGLLDSNGQLLCNPYHYRDSMTDGMMEEAFLRMSKEEIFRKTGIAFMKFNTIYQLLSMKLRQPHILDNAKTLLFMPDLLAYFLTGEKATEYTVASTGQVLDGIGKKWCTELFSTMGISDKICTSIEMPGTKRGILLAAMGEKLGVGKVPLIAVASHDTASAVVAVPAANSDYAYLSSGTWSLMGVEVKTPVINEKTLKWNYTNEGGFEGNYRLLKNIMGLWIVQECKREWDWCGEYHEFDDLVKMAEGSDALKSFIDPDKDCFAIPGDMPGKIQRFCESTRQRIPERKGEIIRCVFESLALKYRFSFEKLEEILDKKLKCINIVGGGANNRLLNQFTANAINRLVICGPTEATAIGNLMVQVIALGEIKDLNEIRQVVKNSFETESYMPKDTPQWDEAYGKFLKLL